MADNSLMSGVLTANQAIGNINPMGNFVQGMNDAQDLQKKQMENAKTQYQQDIEVKLQKAINESIDPTTGQPDYDKLSDLGVKYGIAPQQMNFAVKHLKDNWSAFYEVAQNMQNVEMLAKSGWNKPRTAKKVETRGSVAAPPPTTTSEPKTGAQSGAQGATTPFKAIPELTDAQKAIAGADEYADSKVGAANGLIGGLNTAVAQGSNPTGAHIPTRPQVTSPAMDSKGNVVGTAGDSWTSRPVTAPAAGKTMDLGETKLTAEAPKTEGHTLYQNLANMKVNNPLAMLGGAGGEGDGDGAVQLTAPRNANGVDVTTNPQGDIEGNTKTWLRNHAYNSGDYDTDYNQAMDDVASAVLAKKPMPPIPTGDYKKDTEARNAYRNEVQKVMGEAMEAKLKLRDDIAKGNWEAASKTLESLKGTIKIGSEVYRARDDAARATALSLIPVKSEIPQFEKDLKKVQPTDPVGLQTMLARGARLYAGAMNPGAQVSEGSLAEVGRQIFGEHGVDLTVLGAQAAAAFFGAPEGEGFKAVAEVLASYASKFDGATIKQRLGEMADGAKTAIETTLMSSLVGYGEKKVKHETETEKSDLQKKYDELKARLDALEGSEPTSPPASAPIPSPEPKKPWSKKKAKASAPKADRSGGRRL